MAREHAKVKLSIWADDDFRRLSPPAQHLYFVLMTSPKLDYCGITDWRPARIAQLAGGWSARAVEIAAQELAEQRYIVVDDAAEEVLIRSFIRNDELMEQPNLAVAMRKAHMAVASSMLRGVVIHELRRLRTDKPDLKGWGKVGGWVDDQASVDPSNCPPFQASVNPSGNPNPNPSGNPSGTGCPTTATTTATSTAPATPTAKTEVQDSGENRYVPLRAVDVTKPPTKPTSSCTRHPHGNPTDEDCEGCRRDRLHKEAEAQRAADKAAREAERAARDCTRCDGTWVIDEDTKLPTRRRCDHRRTA